jgi:glycosyltransferase involved in cell wall biosynthesis
MNGTLGYITPVRAFSRDGKIWMQAASGRVAEALAAHFEKVYLCSRVVHEPPPAPFDSPLNASNLELVPQPHWRNTAESLRHFTAIARSYLETCRRSDALFVRGMCPYIAILYVFAALHRKRVCHWIVGDPLALLRTGKRNGTLLDALARLYALQDRLFTRMGRWLAGGALLCNGRELARAYASPKTAAVVSGTIRNDEFFDRADTCSGPVVRILFVGFVRPEKGIEYLIDAVSSLGSGICWELEIAGEREFPGYARKLEAIANARRISDRIRWSGYLPNGAPVWERMRASDLFVLPTLSEGTPHVLVEARANGLPCISTNVGGVPSTVTDGYDALLVPPKDALALARAIDRVISDGELRRTLIRNGLIAARRQTLDHFISAVLRALAMRARAEHAQAAQESRP